MEFVVREAEPGDERAFAHVHVQSARESGFSTFDPGYTDERYAQNLIDNETFVDSPNTRFIARTQEGEPAGIIVYGPPDDNTGRGTANVHIAAFYVLEKFHGTGAAQELMNAAAIKMRSQGYNSADLTVVGNNTRARRFYERLGGILLQTAEPESKQGWGIVRYGWPDLGNMTAVPRLPTPKPGGP